MFKKAHKVQAKYALVIGQDEIDHGTISVKNMVNGESITMRQCDVIDYLIGH